MEAKLDVSRATIAKWRRRFLEHGVEGLMNRHRGRPRWKLTVRLRARVLAAIRRPTPDGATHWSCRRLAAHLGVDKNIVHRVWREADLRPHRLGALQERDRGRRGQDDGGRRRSPPSGGAFRPPAARRVPPMASKGLRRPCPHAPPLLILLLLDPLRSLCRDQQLDGEPDSVSGRET